LQEFHVGGMVVAAKTGLPVVPVIIQGSGKCLSKGMSAPKPGPVRVTVLDPIPAGTYPVKQRETFRQDLFAVMNTAYKEQRSGSQS
jgi:1-acyl-sn-glycerol-3-phosphate acyltransferase